MTQPTRKLTMGSLFDGISGFPLASVRCGIEPIWASDIEPFPIISISQFPRILPTMNHIHNERISPTNSGGEVLF